MVVCGCTEVNLGLSLYENCSTGTGFIMWLSIINDMFLGKVDVTLGILQVIMHSFQNLHKTMVYAHCMQSELEEWIRNKNMTEHKNVFHMKSYNKIFYDNML